MSGITAHGNLPFDVPYISEIAENLWQGGCRNGLFLPTFIDHVVSLFPWESYGNTSDMKSYLTVEMFDSLEQGTEQILDIASWVNSCRNSGPVLVHCQAGLNRSSLVAGATLVLNGEMSGPEAVTYLREKRSPACLCNPAFEKWLTELSFTDADPRECCASCDGHSCED
jgi:protein-tyrosine phosphatase